MQRLQPHISPGPAVPSLSPPCADHGWSAQEILCVEGIGGTGEVVEGSTLGTFNQGSLGLGGGCLATS